LNIASWHRDFRQLVTSQVDLKNQMCGAWCGTMVRNSTFKTIGFDVLGKFKKHGNFEMTSDTRSNIVDMATKGDRIRVFTIARTCALGTKRKPGKSGDENPCIMQHAHTSNVSKKSSFFKHRKNGI